MILRLLCHYIARHVPGGHYRVFAGLLNARPHGGHQNVLGCRVKVNVQGLKVVKGVPKLSFAPSLL